MRTLISRRALFLVLSCVLLGSGLTHAIVGGTDANWGMSPWLAKNVCQATGQKKWEPCGCSSTVIDAWYAVTAAHCLNRDYPGRVGLQFSDGDVIEVVEEIGHADFKRDSLHLKFIFGLVSESVADIGLQRLARPVGSAGGKAILNIFNAKYSSDGNDIVGAQATLRGWGQTQLPQPFLPPPATFSPTLQQIDEIVQDNTQCQFMLDFMTQYLSGGFLQYHAFRFNSSLMCATPVGASLNFPKPPDYVPAGACEGDSGGVLVTAGSKKKPEVVLGLLTDTLSVTRETPCANGLDIYTRLTPAYVDWMRSAIMARWVAGR